MANDYVWVLGCDAHTDETKEFIRCHVNNARYHESLYVSKGYAVKTLTSEELDELIERNKRNNS